MNLIETLAQQLGYAPLRKIDPVTQDTRGNDGLYGEVEQAVLPATMAAFFNRAASGNGLTDLVNTNASSNWTTTLFGNNAGFATAQMAGYTGETEDSIRQRVAAVANGFMSWFRSQPGDHSEEDLRRVLDSAKQNISSYLPTGLHIGDAFNRSTLDDASNKMEGPVSGLMHRIENLFSSNEQPEQNPARTDQ